jgi:hypothetical protein
MVKEWPYISHRQYSEHMQFLTAGSVDSVTLTLLVYWSYLPLA